MGMELLSNLDWAPLWLSAKLAIVTTIVLLIVGIPISYFLAYSKSKWKSIFEALIALPIILPPTVIGFYFLLAFSPNFGLGKILNDWFDIQLVFSFSGLVLASLIYSLPFMIQPLQNGFTNLPRNLKEASYILGKSKWETLYYVLLPNIKTNIITGIVLTFAHTIGEFGVVLMVGGSIPNKTKVASSVIYEHVESLNYEAAHVYSAILLILSFIILVSVYTYNRNQLNVLNSK